MSVSEQLRGFAESAYEVKDIPLHVKMDLEAFAMDVYEIERERDERKVVTSEEHARVVHLYIDMIADRASENAKLLELVAKALKCKGWCDRGVGCCPLKRSMEELRIEVK